MFFYLSQDAGLLPGIPMSAADLNTAAVLLHYFQIQKGTGAAARLVDVLQITGHMRRGRLEKSLDNLKRAGFLEAYYFEKKYLYVGATPGTAMLIGTGGKNFHKYGLRNFIELQSKYSKRLALLLGSWSNVDQVTFTHLQMCGALCVPSLLKDHLSNFRRVVFGPALAEIKNSFWRYDNLECGENRGGRFYTFTLRAALPGFHNLELSEKLAAHGLTQYQVSKVVNYLTENEVRAVIRGVEMQKINGRISGTFAAYLWVSLSNQMKLKNEAS